MKDPRLISRRDSPPLDAFIKLQRASMALFSRVNPPLAKAGLTESQFGVLEALFSYGPLNQGELSQKILKTSGNMTMVVDNLEKRALVRRERSSSDRRVVNVHLTKEGETLIREVLPEEAGAIEREMSVLSAEELKILADLCRKLGKLT